MAETNNQKDEKPQDGIDYEKIIPKDESIETSHQISIRGETIQYKATAGTLVLKEDDGKPKASIFFVAYTLEGVEDLSIRPLTFSFNGGPGSSSVWMHLGVLGPRRVASTPDNQVLPPPYKLQDNQYSILDVSDLVFIDPVSTGFSRAVPGEEPKQFHGVDEDIETVAKFIRRYTTETQRWGSPKFLIGESYGTTRAAGLSGFLQQKYGMYLNGIMLISSILNFQSARFDIGNDLPYVLFLPTYTASAWYHQKLPADLQDDLRQTLTEVENFAENDYALALMKGAKLSADERSHIIQQLARYTGLSETYIERANLRVSIHRFAKELLRDQGHTVGRFDSRFTGIDRDAVGEQFEYDPSFAIVQGPYTATFNDYIHTELNFKSELPYEILAGIYEGWNYGKYANQYVNVAETLRQAMTQNPHLKVFVGNGYYDLATPYFATEYTFNHLGIPAGLQENITMSYYEAGHMMYVHEASLIKLKDDLQAFIEAAL
jgi:carboxypeptidase C (cathepsin A)